MKTKLATLKLPLLSFCLGFLLASLGAIFVLRSAKLHVREARIIQHEDKRVTIMFYHDPTDQVMLVQIPVTKYESDPRNGRAVVETVSALMWQDVDFEAWRLMSDSAYNVEKDRLLPKVEWTQYGGKP